MNIRKFFGRFPSRAHLPPALQDSVNLIAQNVILFHVKVFGRNTKRGYASEIFHKSNCMH